MTVSEIATQNIDTRTVYKDIDAACEKMTLFSSYPWIEKMDKVVIGKQNEME
jgi:hypothetical protein